MNETKKPASYKYIKKHQPFRNNKTILSVLSLVFHTSILQILHQAMTYHAAVSTEWRT